MGLAAQERADAAEGKGCLGKAADDEPVFILRAQDKSFPTMVTIWADELQSLRGRDFPKVVEARALVEKARVWQATHATKYPD